jgi:branched-chain amino acid transport system substrate-binding protein
MPLSGDAGTFGKNALQGATLAIEQAKPETGSAFVVKAEDSRGTAQDAVAAGRKLISVDHAVMLIGDVTSAGTHALLPVIAEARVPLISPSASDPALSGASPYFARVWPSDVFEARVIAGYARDRGFKRIAVVYANTDYGVAMVQEFKKQDDTNRIAFEARVDRETLDYRPTIERIRLTSADALFLVLYPEDSRRLLRQMADAKVSIPMLATATFEDPKLLTSPGAPRVVFASPVPPPDSMVARQRFIEAYKQRFGEPAGVLSDMGYDAANILMGAWTSHSAQGPDAVIRAIRDTKNYQGVGGTLSFTPDGDVVKDYRLRTIRDGAFAWLASQ